MNYIEQYLESGFSVIPVDKNNKTPIVKWGEYQKKKPSRDQVFSWFGEYDCGAGLITGSDNLVCVDCDDPNIYDTYFSEFKNMVQRTPSGGINFFVRSTSVPKSLTNINEMALDIRGIGGFAIVPVTSISNSEREELDKLEHPEKRYWIGEPKEPESVPDIMQIISDKLPHIEVKYKIPGSARDWAKENLPKGPQFSGHGYDQYYCIFSDHKDETPSLTVYDQSFHCFGCKKHGSYFDLVKALDGGSEEEVLAKYPGLVKEPKTAAEKLAFLAESKCKMVKDQNGACYLVITEFKSLGLNIIPTKGDKVRHWLRVIYSEAFGCTPSTTMINDAVDIINAKCDVEGERINIFRRFGGNNDGIWYDLGVDNYLYISPSRVSVFQDCGIYFFREENHGFQEIPVFHSIDDIWKIFDLINIKEEADKYHILAWLITCFLPDAQYPILLFHGTKGSVKTHSAQIIKRLIDPMNSKDNEISLWKPNDIDNLLFSLSHNSVVLIDNVSRVDQSTSDVLCQAVTGGVIQKRELFTTNKSITIPILSRVMMTSINNEVAHAGDLADRAIPIELDVASGKYINNKYIDDLFEENKTIIFGALVKLVQMYLRYVKETESDLKYSEFRMTDYANVGKFLTHIFDSELDFAQTYAEKQKYLCSETLESEVVSEFIYSYAKEHVEGMKGATTNKITFKDLYKEMDTWANNNNPTMKNSKTWPRTAKGLSQKLRRIEKELDKLWGVKMVRVTILNSPGIIIYKKAGKEKLSSSGIPED